MMFQATRAALNSQPTENLEVTVISNADQGPAKSRELRSFQSNCISGSSSNSSAFSQLSESPFSFCDNYRVETSEDPAIDDITLLGRERIISIQMPVLGPRRRKRDFSRAALAHSRVSSSVLSKILDS